MASELDKEARLFTRLTHAVVTEAQVEAVRTAAVEGCGVVLRFAKNLTAAESVYAAARLIPDAVVTDLQRLGLQPMSKFIRWVGDDDAQIMCDLVADGVTLPLRELNKLSRRNALADMTITFAVYHEQDGAEPVLAVKWKARRPPAATE